MDNQHELVASCQSKYKVEPLPFGEHWEDAHYPIPECLGGTETVCMWSRDHTAQGLLQSEEFNHPCVHNMSKERDLQNLRKHYPEYVPLLIKWLSELGRRSGNESVANRSGIHDPKYKEKIRLVSRENGANSITNHLGVFDPANRKALVESGKKNGPTNGRKGFEEQKGIHSPESRRARAESECRSVKCVSPENEVQFFKSAKEAALGTGIPKGTLPKLARRGVLVDKGKWEGWTIQYLS